MRAKEFEIKKRDPNWRTMQDIRRSGAGGQHKDKKKAEKQGYEKHKGKDVAEGTVDTEKQILTRIRQIMYDRKLSGTDSNAGELLRLKQKLKDIRNKQEEGIGGTIAGGIGQFVGNKIDPLHGEIMRAHGEMAGRKAEYTIRKYMHLLQKALKQQLDSGEKKEGVSEGDYPDGSSLKTPSPEEWQKEYEKAKMAVKKAKTQQEYEAASDRAGRIKDLLASKGIKVGPVLGKEGVSEGDEPDEQYLDKVISDLHKDALGFRPDQEFGREWMSSSFEEKLEIYNNLLKSLHSDMDEGRRDYGYDSFGNSLRPGDDEGSTEPPNNFAIYINGKKWKVFQGRGQYADDQYEMQQFRQLQAMAQRKSQETGKKWEVSRTLEPATK